MSLNMNDKPWRQSQSGKKIYPLHPEMTEIDTEDIFTAYQNICRWGGQYYITLGMHCEAVKECIDGGFISHTPRSRSLAYLHDAHEAYIGDVPSPSGGSVFFKRDGELISLAQLKEEWDARIFNALNVKFTEEEKRYVDLVDKIGGRVEAICFTCNVDNWAKIKHDELSIAQVYLDSMLSQMGIYSDGTEYKRYHKKLLASVID